MSDLGGTTLDERVARANTSKGLIRKTALLGAATGIDLPRLFDPLDEEVDAGSITLSKWGARFSDLWELFCWNNTTDLARNAAIKAANISKIAGTLRNADTS